MFDNLVFRYEEPNGMARWDSPLFTVPHVDSAPDLAAIWDAIASGAKVTPNYATVLKPAVENDYLYELDKTTQEIVAMVLEHQRSAGPAGGVLPVEECETVRVMLLFFSPRVASPSDGDRVGAGAAGEVCYGAAAAENQETVCQFE